jgi:hypothetical protein
MKAAVSMVVVSLALGAAFAQDAPPKQDKKASAPAAATTAATTATTPLPELKTLMYKGVLVDMSCATSENCKVKADSSSMGMKLEDGRVVKFDMVGNTRAQDELKNNKRWSKDLGADKPIHATVSGVLQGEKLIVSSIH